MSATINSDSIKNNDPLFVTSFCYTERLGKKIPSYPYVVAFTGQSEFVKPGDQEEFRGFTEEEIKNQFKDELAKLAELWNEKTEGYAPLILLTSLAAGTDQIIAQAALELKDLNVKLIVVLPMPRVYFELTLPEENRDNFKDLLKQADSVYELQLAESVIGHEADLKNICKKTEVYRQIQYRLHAEFLSLHSHLLFACWDGFPDNSKSEDTTETIMFKLKGNTTLNNEVNLLTFSSVGSVVQFLLPGKDYAQNYAQIKKESGLNWNKIPVFYWCRERLRRVGATQPDISHMCEANRLKIPVAQYPFVVNVIKNISSLNIEGIRLAEENSSHIENDALKTRDGLFGIYPPKDAPEEEIQKRRDEVKPFIDPGTDVFIDHYVFADMLAMKFQKKTNQTVHEYAKNAFIFVLFSILLNLMGGFSTISNSNLLCTIFSWVFVLFYLWALFRAFRLFWRSKKNGYHYKYHYYRSIAEAFRIQIFWRIASISGCVSGFYRSHQSFKTEWLRAALNSIDVLVPSPKNSSNPSWQARLDFVKKIWILGQQQFFTNRILNKRKKVWTDYIANPYFLIIATFIALSFVPFFDYFQRWIFNLCKDSSIALGVISLFYCAVALFSAWIVYRSINAQEHMKIMEANRYEREIFPFDRATLLLENNFTNNSYIDTAVKKSILCQLGEEALAENSDWLLSVENRSLAFRNMRLNNK